MIAATFTILGLASPVIVGLLHLLIVAGGYRLFIPVGT
jgi:hypothetical protein